MGPRSSYKTVRKNHIRSQNALLLTTQKMESLLNEGGFRRLGNYLEINPICFVSCWQSKHGGFGGMALSRCLETLPSSLMDSPLGPGQEMRRGKVNLQLPLESRPFCSPQNCGKGEGAAVQSVFLQRSRKETTSSAKKKGSVLEREEVQKWERETISEQ